MNNLGLHLRLFDSFENLAIKANELELTIFQNFLINTATGKYIKFDSNDIKNFLALRGKFQDLYLHASYWINLCSESDGGVRLLAREIENAKRLEYTHIILHPGSTKGLEDRNRGIDYLAKRLNKICKNEFDLKIVLENTAHGIQNIGSELEDFKLIQDKLDFEVFYCLDTAHAFAQGYDIKNNSDLFINDVKKYMGLDKVVLIHLNDSLEPLGSCRDMHALPGFGDIGLEALKEFISKDIFKQKNVILESPGSSTEEQNKEIIKLFSTSILNA